MAKTDVTVTISADIKDEKTASELIKIRSLAKDIINRINLLLYNDETMNDSDNND